MITVGHISAEGAHAFSTGEASSETVVVKCGFSLHNQKENGRDELSVEV